MKKVIDTNILLNYPEIILHEECIIPSIVLQELENIKTSNSKTEEVRFKARQSTRMLTENEDKYNVHIITNETYHIVEQHNMPCNNDNLIIASCLEVNEPVCFCSNDLCARLIATNIFEIKSCSYQYDKYNDLYKGYKEVILSDEELIYLYNHLNENLYNCLINEYLIVKDCFGNIAYKYKWNGNFYEEVMWKKQIQSHKLGVFKPLDVYQECAIDSICNNDITVLTGRSGAGKTIIPLSYFISNLESEKIRKLYIVFHFEPLRGAKTLGYEKGDHITKILNTGSIANILVSKLGDITEVERLIEEQKLEIIPTANIRGVEFGSDDAVFVTECQNIDTYTLKTIIQRCKDGCKQVYEGDVLEQSDLFNKEIGLNKMINVFKNHKKFGYVKLKNNYRSELCTLADNM